MKISTRSFLKKSMCILFSFVCLQATLFSQDVILTTQAEVDAFDPIVTEINGSLTIGQFSTGSEINNLSNLSKITSIIGSLSIIHNDSLQDLEGLSNLIYIGRDLLITENLSLTSLGGLSNIDTIGNDLNIGSNEALQNINDLSSLNFIGTDLRISYNNVLLNIDGLSNVKSINGVINIIDNLSLLTLSGLRNVTSVEKFVHITNNNSLRSLEGLSNIVSIGGDLIISGNDNIIDLIGLANLELVVGKLQINKNEKLINLNGLSNITRVIGDLNITDNDQLENLSGLPKLSETRNLNIRNNPTLRELGNLSTLKKVADLTIYNNESLTTIDGLYSLNTIFEINISYNNLLENIDALINIDYINGIVISHNPSLLNVDGLRNANGLTLSSLNISNNDELLNVDGLILIQGIVRGDLIISHNAKLSNIDGLKNIGYITEDYFGYGIGNLIVTDNPLLSDCCGILNLLIRSNAVEGDIIISNNPAPCSSNSEILTTSCFFNPIEHNYSIIGQTSIDFVEDGCDPSDVVNSHMKYNIQNDIGETGFVFGATNGLYKINLPFGVFTITPEMDNPNLFEITPEQIEVIFPDSISPYTQDFCITPLIDTTIITIDIIPLELARPGFDTQYKLICSNEGTLPISGILSYIFPTEVMDNLGPSGLDIMEDAGLITWDIEELLPFESVEYILEFKLNTPTDNPALVGGEQLDFFAKFETSNHTDNKISDAYITQEVVNSYDPNDKRCLEGSTLTPEMIGNYVHYIIRFENTGTANAVNVAVTDVIDTSTFEINTLSITDASHEMETRITDAHLVEFIFRGINLPFADDMNDGYVAFKIKTSSDLVVSDTLSNTANIYFDFNPPIRTNTATTRYENITSTTQINHLDIEVYPNPVTDILNVKSYSNHSLAYKVYNTLGQLQSIKSSRRTINLSTLNNGTYLLQITDTQTKESTVKKIIVAR